MAEERKVTKPVDAFVSFCWWCCFIFRLGSISKRTRRSFFQAFRLVRAFLCRLR